MVRGIGIDMASISEIERLAGPINAEYPEALDPFITHTFSPAEIEIALSRHRPAEFLAGRFAVKEAAFKALAPLTREGFDLRIIETLCADSGAPYINLATPRLQPVLEETGVSELLVSITNEDNYAVAIVLAQ